MKFLTTKHFKFQISQLSTEEKALFIEYIIDAASWNIPSSSDRFIQSIINEHIIPYLEHKNKISEVRRTVWQSANLPYKSKNKQKIPAKIQEKEWTPEEIELWFNEPEEIQLRYWLWKYRTPIEDIPNGIPEETYDDSETQRKFPERPEEYCPFPEPDVQSLQKTPQDFSPTTSNFWDIFLTLDKNSLNELPFSWHEIAWDIQERMTQIDRITTPVVLNIKEAKISKEPTE